MRLGELCSAIPLRIPHPQIDKLARQAKGVGIFAIGEITLIDAYCTYLAFTRKMNYTTSFSNCQGKKQKNCGRGEKSLFIAENGGV